MSVVADPGRAVLPVAQPRSRGGGGRCPPTGWSSPSPREAVSGAFDFVGLDSVQSIRRLLEIASIATLGLENSIVRSRTLISAALAAAKLLETGELEDRIASLETAIGVGRDPTVDLLADDVP